jgi:UDP-N-acetylmuramoyl-tripeptide--D-alanyl-D-alanine ligase
VTTRGKTPLWSWAELCKIFDCSLTGEPVTGLSIDSRTTQPGDMFIALSGDPGPRFGSGNAAAGDGHDFIDIAIQNGASAVLAHKDCRGPVIKVDDTLDGLWQLGRAARARCAGGVVAITGSSGKTTLRSWLESILAEQARTHGSTGSFNNHWGVPLSLGRMPRDTEIGVFEVGTSHPGEIAPLATLVAPDIAVILNVLPAHLGNFQNMDALIEEKLSIEAGLGGAGILILPFELARNDAGRTAGHQTITFGTDERADVFGTATPVDGGSNISASVLGKPVELYLPFTGEHRLRSSLAVLAVIGALGLNPSHLAPGFATLTVPAGRGTRFRTHDITLIDDSYNANPISMAMAIDSLRWEPGRRKIAFLGEILELGDSSISAHQEIGHNVATLDEVYTFGDGFNGVNIDARFHRHYSRVEDFDLDTFTRSLQPGDNILVKGSNKVFWVNNFAATLRSKLPHSEIEEDPG